MASGSTKAVLAAMFANMGIAIDTGLARKEGSTTTGGYEEL